MEAHTLLLVGHPPPIFFDSGPKILPHAARSAFLSKKSSVGVTEATRRRKVARNGDTGEMADSALFSTRFGIVSKFGFGNALCFFGLLRNHKGLLVLKNDYCILIIIKKRIDNGHGFKNADSN